MAKQNNKEVAANAAQAVKSDNDQLTVLNANLKTAADKLAADKLVADQQTKAAADATAAATDDAGRAAAKTLSDTAAGLQAQLLTDQKAIDDLNTQIATLTDKISADNAALEQAAKDLAAESAQQAKDESDAADTARIFAEHPNAKEIYLVKGHKFTSLSYAKLYAKESKSAVTTIGRPADIAPPTPAQ